MGLEGGRGEPLLVRLCTGMLSTQEPPPWQGKVRKVPYECAMSRVVPTFLTGSSAPPTGSDIV